MPAYRVLVALVAACAALVFLPGTAHARKPVLFSAEQVVAPGVTFRTFTWRTVHGDTAGYAVRVDLSTSKVGLDLLEPADESTPIVPSAMAVRQGAVAGVNGDFFNNSESQHPGVQPTYSPVGPEVATSRPQKAAVPDGQRFGPGLAPGTTTKDVFGLGTDGRARVASLDLRGRVRSGDRTLPLTGFNQYAIPVDGIGAYTDQWGSVSRVRATCGTDTNRAAPCTDRTFEVVVAGGRVTEVHGEPGTGPIPHGSTVLLGREDGADRLDDLEPGDPVTVTHHLVPSDLPRFRFAIGGAPILRDGTPLPGIDAVALAPRTSAGASRDGTQVHLVAMDGRSEVSVGVTLVELADLMRQAGADDAVNLDGGGSTSMVTRDPATGAVVVRNHPSDGAERPVANGIGVFAR